MKVLRGDLAEPSEREPRMTRYGPDLELAERMLAGDRGASEEFGERYTRALYRYAVSRLEGRRDLARDIVQTTLVKALAKLETFRGEAALSTWLCACCHNEIRMHFRKLGSTPQEVELEESLEPAPEYAGPQPTDTEKDVLRREQATRVHVALDLLPEDYARALEWKYLENITVKEIASRLERSPKAAESLLTRAREAFRQHYGDLDGAFAEDAEQGDARHER